MKVIYAPPGENPVEVARQHFKRRGGGGGVLATWWPVLAVVVFVAFGFVAGPFKGKENRTVDLNPAKTEAVQPAPVEAAVDLLEGFCKLPAGGMLAQLDTAWIVDGAEFLQVRCESEGLVKLSQPQTP